MEKMILSNSWYKSLWLADGSKTEGGEEFRNSSRVTTRAHLAPPLIAVERPKAENEDVDVLRLVVLLRQRRQLTGDEEPNPR